MTRPPHHALIENLNELVERGDLREADRVSRLLLERASGDPLSWIALGDLRLAEGRIKEALEATTRALVISPGDPDFLLRHARVLFAAGRRGAGVSALDAAANQCEPDHRRDSLVGALYCQIDLPARAIPFLRRALDAQPLSGRYLYNLAACQRMTGDFGDAWRNCEQALECDPGDAEALLLRAELNRVMRRPHGIAQLRDALARAPGDSREIFLRFALVRECEDQGLYDEAFEHALAGNRLKRARMRYDVAEDIAVLDTLRGTHNRAAVEGAAPGLPTSEPIFVMGLPRTGTTLVERILGAHERVVSAGEPLAFGKAMAGQLAGSGFRGDKVEAIRQSLSLDMARLGGSYIDEIHGQVSVSDRFVDKLPLNYLYVGLIRAALPDARIILVDRDPMDTLWAIYKTLFAGAYPFSYDVAELARYQRSYAKLAAHWAKQFGDRVLHVRYEDIVADLDGQARRIVDHCGLDWQDGCRSFERSRAASTTASAVQVRMPLYSGSVGLWKKYERRLLAHLPA